ncbi:hypothetical protein XENOCAPTIV_023222 [Xenoophorus captivus]|uniref:Uncharacterized protein n=1 Tax=Xenoophorus captivus TaxID=1517983 RepID=A0ABV0QWB6_9TELE
MPSLPSYNTTSCDIFTSLCPSFPSQFLALPEGDFPAQRCSATTTLPSVLSAQDRKSKRPEPPGETRGLTFCHLCLPWGFFCVCRGHTHGKKTLTRSEGSFTA